jgi:hypothetical protein
MKLNNAIFKINSILIWLSIVFTTPLPQKDYDESFKQSIQPSEHKTLRNSEQNTY